MKRIFNTGTVVAFILGVLLTFGGMYYFQEQQILKVRNSYAKYESQSEAVKWVVANPEYANVLKKNHDAYMSAAEDAFKQSLNNSEEVSK